MHAFKETVTAKKTTESGSAEKPSRGAEGWATAGVVLVVDDESSIVASLEKIFNREGLTVMSATDGDAALVILHRNRMDG